MMIGVPEEMMTELEGEEWMMGHVVARTPNHGSPSVDLVVGVSERRPVRRAGALLVVTVRTMVMMMLMEQNDPVIASETDVLKGTRPGGEHPQMMHPHGEKVEGRMLIVMTAVSMTSAVSAATTAVMSAVTTAATETVEMTVKPEVHPEVRRKEVPGVVEVKTRGRNGTESGPRTESVTQMERRVGALTKKTLVASRTSQMMMVGLLSAAKQPLFFCQRFIDLAERKKASIFSSIFQLAAASHSPV